ncbi:hypothetical protein EC973_008466 [Apophysomyces ossiformis]|uniref:Uncharacterized protein n=1 Tax=Apophysomyces ossiformis TaxID=679940 RepID=A0A8H7BNL7_9FUNG|nr:hypothetical protein EC973_008466 [Apophysomyces ossiformis]
MGGVLRCLHTTFVFLFLFVHATPWLVLAGAGSPTILTEKRFIPIAREDIHTIPEIDFTPVNVLKTTITRTTTTTTTTTSTAITTTKPSNTLSTSSLLPSHNLNTQNVTNGKSNNTDGAPVEHTLNCTVEASFCAKVDASITTAINIFTQVVNVKTPLRIHFQYHSFCDTKCANDTVGWGAPTLQFTLPFQDGPDLNYVYPQALAKQLAPYSNTTVWSDYDVDIEINHDAYMNAVNYTEAYKSGWNGTGVPPDGKFWFQQDNSSIAGHQIDLRYIVLHELLHGLGFISAWAAYFWTNDSPFRALVEGVVEDITLQLVTPGPFWFVHQDTGPTYVTGFQPTMIFDKFLAAQVTDLANATANATKTVNLSTIGFNMQNFCVSADDSFIVNFLKNFNNAPQSFDARQLWVAMSQPDTLSFNFEPPSVENSTYNTNRELNQTYQSMQLLTGEHVLASEWEQFDKTNNRPGIAIAHVSDKYLDRPDFIMTGGYITGNTLEDLVNSNYRGHSIPYNISLSNGTVVQQIYRSPIGPGILRILDSMGYSTVLTMSNYTTDGNVKTYKSNSICDSRNNNHALSDSSSASISSAETRRIPPLVHTNNEVGNVILLLIDTSFEWGNLGFFGQ